MGYTKYLPPDPRPSKAIATERALRKDLEKSTPGGFGWVPPILLGMLGIKIAFDIESEVKKLESRHDAEKQREEERSKRRRERDEACGRERDGEYAFGKSRRKVREMREEEEEEEREKRGERQDAIGYDGWDQARDVRRGIRGPDNAIGERGGERRMTSVQGRRRLDDGSGYGRSSRGGGSRYRDDGYPSGRGAPRDDYGGGSRAGDDYTRYIERGPPARPRPRRYSSDF